MTSQARYALYAVFDLAYSGGNEPLQVKEISRRQQIPPRYLEQIFQKLRRAGLIRSKRGPRGGYLLARNPSEITMRDVIEAIEGPVGDVFCEDGASRAGRRGKRPDGARESEALWKEMSGEANSLLCSITLEDLCARGERLGIKRASDRSYMYFI